MAPDLFLSFTSILADESLDNVRASEQLAELAQNFRSMSSVDRTGVYDQPQQHIDAFLDAIFKRLELLESEEHISDIETQGHLMTALLKFMPSPTPDNLAAAFFERDFESILCAVLGVVFQLEDVETNQDSQTLIVLILQTLTDLAEAQCPGSGPTQRKVGGQSKVGQAALHMLIECLPATRCMRVNVRRSASSLLLTLLTSNTTNQRLLAAKADELPQVFDDFLRTCGDFPTQVDLLETLYRCCKYGLKDLAGQFIKDEVAKKRFLQLLNRSSKSVDLAKELRQLLGMINAAESKPTVHSFLAQSVEYSIPDVVRPADYWVDVGDAQITFSAQIMDQMTSPGAWDEVPDEPLDFEFKHIKRAHVADDDNDPSMCVVDITMIQNPDSLLEDYPALASQPVSVVLLARKDVAAPLLECLPKSMVEVGSQDAAFLPLSQSQQQRCGRNTMKMSMGLTVYQTTRPATSVQPSSLRQDPAVSRPGAAGSTAQAGQDVSTVAANGTVTPAPSLPGFPVPVPAAPANGDLRATTPELDQHVEQIANTAADAVRAIALEAANAAIAAQGAVAIVHAEATVVTAADGTHVAEQPLAVIPNQPVPEAAPDAEAANGIYDGAQVDEQLPAAKVPSQKGKGKAAAAVKNGSTGSRGGRQAKGKGPAAARTPPGAAAEAVQGKGAGRRAPLSPLDVLARDLTKAHDAGEPADEGDGEAAPPIARLESSPEWLKLATAALPMGGSRGHTMSVDHSLEAKASASPRAFKSRTKGASVEAPDHEPHVTGEQDQTGGRAKATGGDPYELHDSQEDNAVGARAGTVPAALGGSAGIKSIGQKRFTPKKPAGRLAALGITSPKKGAMERAVAAAVPATSASGISASDATKEPVTRPASTGAAAAAGTAGNSAAPAAPRSRGGGKPGRAPLPPGGKPAAKKQAAAVAGRKKTSSSPAESIEYDASLPPLPKGKAKGDKQRAAPAGVQGTLESADTIEDPDSFPEKPGQRSQAGPAQGKGNKRTTALPVATAGKRPKREAGAKAAQAIRDQAIAESPTRTRHEAAKRGSGAAGQAHAAAAAPAATPARVSPAPAPAHAAPPRASADTTYDADGPDLDGPSMYDFHDEEDHVLDDYAPPQRKPSPPLAKAVPAAKRASGGGKSATAAKAAPSRAMKQSAAPRKPSVVPEITHAADGDDAGFDYEAPVRKTALAAAAAPTVPPEHAVAAATLRHQFDELDREELLAEEANEPELRDEPAPELELNMAGDDAAVNEPPAHREGSGCTEGRAQPAASGLTDPAGRPQPSLPRPNVLALMGLSPRGARPQALPVHKSPLPAGAPLLPTKKQLAVQQRRRKAPSGALPPPVAAPAPSPPSSVHRAVRPVAQSSKHITIKALAAAKLAVPLREPTPPVESAPGNDTDGDQGYGCGEGEDDVPVATLAPDRAPVRLPALQLPSLRHAETDARDETDDGGLLGLRGRAARLKPPPQLGSEPDEQPAAFKLPELQLTLPSQRAAGTTLAPGGVKRTLPQLTLPSLAGPSAPANKRRKTTGGLGPLPTGLVGTGSLGEPDSQAQRLAQLLRASMAGDSEEGEEDDGLLAIILQTFTKKRQEAKARKAAILEEAKTKVQQATAELDARLNKEARAQAGLVARTLTALDQELQNKYETIFALQEQFNARMQAAWDEYLTVLNSMDTAKQELSRMAASRTAAAQRQVAELRQQADAILSDAMQRAEREEKHARKLQNLPQLLQGVLGT